VTGIGAGVSKGALGAFGKLRCRGQSGPEWDVDLGQPIDRPASRVKDRTEVACPEAQVGEQHRGARDDQDKFDQGQRHLPPLPRQEARKRRGDCGPDGADCKPDGCERQLPFTLSHAHAEIAPLPSCLDAISPRNVEECPRVSGQLVGSREPNLQRWGYKKPGF